MHWFTFVVAGCAGKTPSRLTVPASAGGWRRWPQDNKDFRPLIETVSHPESGRGIGLRARAVWSAILVVCLLPGDTLARQSGSEPSLPAQAPPPAAAVLGPVANYMGLIVREIHFEGVAAREQRHLLDLIDQKVGQPLDRDKVRDSLKTLFATGLFADIQVAAAKNADDQVVLTFA